jgi:DNA-directed RNA polymerase specialized sigma24 family protein
VPVDAHELPIVAARPVEPSEEVQLLLLCIDTLRPLEKALVLLYLDGNDHASTAEVLGLSASNVGTKLARIKDKLRVALEARAGSLRTEEDHATR